MLEIFGIGKKEVAEGAPEELEIVMTRQGFKEFAVGLYGMRNRASDRDTICTLKSVKGKKVVNIVIKIGNSVDMSVGHKS